MSAPHAASRAPSGRALRGGVGAPAFGEAWADQAAVMGRLTGSVCTMRVNASNPMERAVQQELKRRADVVGIFPSEASLTASTILPTSVWRRCRIARMPVALWR